MKTIKNFLLLFIGDGISYILLFFATIYLARVLQVAGFGQLSFAFAFFSFGSFLTNLGLISVGIRDIAQYPVAPTCSETNCAVYSPTAYIRNVIILRQFLSLLTFIVLLIISLVINKPSNVKLLIILYGLSLFPFAFILEWLFLGWQKMFYVSLQKIINSGTYLILLLLLVKRPIQIKNVPIAFLIGNLLGGLFLYLVYRRQSSDNEKLKTNIISKIKEMEKIFKSALPLGLGSILIQFSQNFGIVFLGLIKNDAEVGVFSAANKLVFTLLIIDRVFCNATFPSIARYFVLDKQRLSLILSHLQKLVLIVAIPISIGGVILSSQLIALIYGEHYQRASLIFQVLIWFLFFTMVNTIFTSTLIADKRNKAYLSAIASGVFTNVICNIIFVRPFGALGTAIALTFSELITFIVLRLIVQQFMPITFELKYLLKPLIAATIMVVFIKLLLSKLPIMLLIILAILVYGLIIILIKGIQKQDFLIT
ncbi:MAG: flippase [candidate division WOR-3 bacterium]|nr:flippase [candidate division WOR-3 bacterium]